MGNKGGGRKAFLKAAVNSKQAEALEPEAEPSTSAAQTPSETDAQQISPAAPQRPSKQTATVPPGAVASLSGGDAETRGQMLQRHKKETRIQKETTKKLGKKHKEEAATLEAELDKRQAAELAALEDAEGASEPDDAAASANGLEAILQSATLEGNAARQGPTKAQKRKEKAAAQEAAREARIAAENDAAGDSEKVVEERALEELLLPLGLTIRSIPADGHCLYRAVEDQLAAPQAAVGPHDAAEPSQDGDHAQPAGDYRALRHAAAHWMRGHPDHFLPFISQEEVEQSAGSQEAAYEQYCRDVADSAAWGGELELTALAQALQRHMIVHSVGMPAVDIGPQFKGQSRALQLCYLRHAFGLGEHYNSVGPLSDSQ